MSKISLPARPTLYKGIRMRSRTEARIASRLDTLGLAWEYEPDCFADDSGQYLPDFRITYPSGRRLYLEVKGHNGVDLDAAAVRMEIIWSSEPDAQLMILVANTGDCFIADRDQWDGWNHQNSNLWIED